MTEKRQIPKYNCDLFENNGLDDASTVMKMFERKNRRVGRIFHRNDDIEEEEEVDKNNSYGLHLISRSYSDSDEENTEAAATGKKSEVGIRTIRNLSPVDIAPAIEEEINEPRASHQFKEPKAIVLPTRQNTSLRRSLFQQQTSSAVKKQLICSTPTTQRICSQESFFKGNDTINNLSPIRKTKSSSSNIKGIDEIVIQKQARPQSAPPQEKVAVNSLAALENDLKDQYQLEIEKTPNKKTRVSSLKSAKSFGSTQSTSKKNEHRTPASAQCSPKIKEFTVQVQPMDISEDVISNYRKNQLQKQSTSNQTDVNSLKIVETPTSKHRLTSTKCDNLLARKLQQCESDSDMTEDEEVNHTPSQSNRKSAVKVAKLSLKKHASSSQVIKENVDIIRASVEQTEKSDQESETESSADNDYESAEIEPSEKSDDESEVKSSNNDYESAEVKDDEIDKTENSGKEKTENSERERAEDPESETNDDSDTEASKKSCDTVLFKKPASEIAAGKKKPREIITSNSSLESVHVSPSIVKSLTTFRKTTSENSAASQTQSESTSKRFTLPKRTKAKTKQPDPKISAYLQLSEKSKVIKKNKKDNKNEKKKRTLYIQNLDDELEIEPQPNIEKSSSTSNQLAHSNTDKLIADSDCDLRATVDRIRSSLQSMSSASSDFNAEIPEVEEEVLPSPPKKTTQKRKSSLKRSEEPPKSRRKKIKPVSADESDEEPPKSRRKKMNKPTTSTAVSDQELHTVEHSDAEQKKIRRKRIKRVATEEEEEEQENADEGFSSGESFTVPDNVKYDPNKNGCLRRGLRVRRYPRAWWRHDAESQNYGLVYGTYTQEDYEAELEIKKMYKNKQVTMNQLFKTGLDPSTIDPVMALKKAKELAKQKSSVEPKKPKAKSSKKNVVLPAIDESDTSHAFDPQSTCAFDTPHSRSEIIRKVFEGYTKSNKENIKRMDQHDYALQQIEKIEWTVVGANILFYQFVAGESDGFIKFLPGSEKNRSKTKDSVLKFVLLTGKIDFIINGTEETIENLGFVSIAPGTTYTARNPYDEPAILAFTRLPLMQENEDSVPKVGPFATT